MQEFYEEGKICANEKAVILNLLGNTKSYWVEGDDTQVDESTHSGIMLFCGHKVFHNDKFDEGKGFIPDYWIDDENSLGVVEEYVRKMI